MDSAKSISPIELIELNPLETLAWMSNYHCPPYITMAHSFHAPKGWKIDNRTLKQYALQYVVQGMAEYPISGIPYTTVQGDLLFHRPGEPHSIRTVDGHPYVCISIVFHFGQTSFPFAELFQDRHLLGNYSGHPIERMLTEIVQSYAQPGLAYQMKCQGLLMETLAEASRMLDRDRSKDGGTAIRAKLILIKNYLIDNYYREIRHEELEEASGLSRNHLIAMFKNVFGMTPMKFLTWVRVQKAKELVVQTDLSIGEIARNVGYADVHTFGKMFKKNTGGSLTQFCNTLTSDYLNTRPRISPPEEGAATDD